jgi:hypothetical protein
MKYTLVFEETDDDGFGPVIDTWEKESVIPRVGDTVFLEKAGWMIVTGVGFSLLENKRRIVLISVKQ